LNLGQQLRVRDVALLALLAAPVEGDPLSVAGLDVTVEAVVGGVQLAILEPLVEGWLGVVQGLLRLREPVEELARLPGPEALEVLLRLIVQRPVLDQRPLAKLVRRRELLDIQLLGELALELLRLYYVGGHLTLLDSGNISVL
jgi:hypothetical protein